MLGFVTMIVVQLIENYTTGATAVTGTGVSQLVGDILFNPNLGSSIVCKAIGEWFTL